MHRKEGIIMFENTIDTMSTLVGICLEIEFPNHLVDFPDFRVIRSFPFCTELGGSQLKICGHVADQLLLARRAILMAPPNSLLHSLAIKIEHDIVRTAAMYMGCAPQSLVLPRHPQETQTIVVVRL